jgi:hypothetical protein
MNAPFAAVSLKTSLSRIGSVLVPIVLILFLLLMLANRVAGRGLLIAFGNTESTYRGAGFEWDGDVTAKDFVVYPYEDGDEATAIRFDRVHIETPGWFWVLRAAFDRKLKSVSMDRLHVTLSGGQSAAGYEPTLGDLGPFGAISASPFEAEGCMQDNVWMRDELEQMGLSLGENRLEFDYRVEGARLFTTIVLETPGVSSVTLERVEELPGRANALMLDHIPTRAVSERWTVQDQGFVAARNRFCTKKDGIGLRRFIDRHVEAVERLLALGGFAPDSDSRIAYRRFVRDGGTLSFGGEYGPPLGSDEFYQLRDSGEALTRLNATIEHNGRRNPIVWQRFAPRPLPGLAEGEPTYAALQKERSSAMRGEAVPPAVADGSVATAGTTAAATSPPSEAPATAGEPSGDVPPPAGPVAVAATQAALTTPSAPTETPAAPAANQAGDASAEATPGAVATPAATSTPGTVATPAPSPASSAPTTGVRPGARLEWSVLPNYRGRLVRIWTMHNPPRTVEILSADANAVRVTARLGGGNAEYTIQRPGFLRATLIQ